MEFIGFFALLAYGGWLAFAGAFAVYALSGKVLGPVVMIGMIGVAIVGFALYHAPFTIIVGGG